MQFATKTTSMVRPRLQNVLRRSISSSPVSQLSALRDFPQTYRVHRASTRMLSTNLDSEQKAALDTFLNKTGKDMMKRKVTRPNDKKDMYTNAAKWVYAFEAWTLTCIVFAGLYVVYRVANVDDVSMFESGKTALQEIWSASEKLNHKSILAKHSTVGEQADSDTLAQKEAEDMVNMALNAIGEQEDVEASQKSNRQRFM